MSSSPARTLPPSTSAAPISFHWSREMPITCHWFGPSAPPGIWSDMKPTLRGVGRMPPVTPITSETCSGVLQQPHVEQRVEVGDVAGVEALVLGLDPSSRIAVRNSMIVSKLFSKTALKTKSLRRVEYLA